MMYRFARYLWAGPCTLIGLTLGGIVLLLGGSIRMRSGVAEIALPATGRARRISYDAITFGHVIIGRSFDQLDHLFAHEVEHVRQYERWGALLLLAYPLSSLVQLVRGQSPYWLNHFEIQARERSANVDIFHR